MIMAFSVCVSCGKRIRWCRTESGRICPLDPEPHDDGNILVDGGIARVVRASERANYQELYKSHFATCPNAVAHRRRQGRAE